MTNDRLAIVGLHGGTFRVLDVMISAGAMPSTRGPQGARGLVRAPLDGPRIHATRMGFDVDRGQSGPTQHLLLPREHTAGSSPPRPFRARGSSDLMALPGRVGQADRRLQRPDVLPSRRRRGIHGVRRYCRGVAGRGDAELRLRPCRGRHRPRGSRWALSARLRGVVRARLAYLVRRRSVLLRSSGPGERRFSAVLDTIDVDVVYVVFEGVDRLQHLHYQYLVEGSQWYARQAALEVRDHAFEYFAEVDRAIGDIVDWTGSN